MMEILAWLLAAAGLLFGLFERSAYSYLRDRYERLKEENDRLEEKLRRSKDKNRLLNAKTKQLEQTLAAPRNELHQQNWRLRTDRDEVVRWINRLIDEARRSDSRKIQALRRDAISCFAKDKRHDRHLYLHQL